MSARVPARPRSTMARSPEMLGGPGLIHVPQAYYGTAHVRDVNAYRKPARLAHSDLIYMYDPYWIGRQAMRADADITEAQLAELVSHFYGKVRRDPELGPVFNGAISDWDTHLEKLTAFWSSVMLGTGRYRGQPMVAHMQLGPAIKIGRAHV